VVIGPSPYVEGPKELVKKMPFTIWTVQEREIFFDSLERCIETRDFLDRFYQFLLESSPIVKEKFAHTDFKSQKRAIKVSFYMILMASEGKPEGFAHLDRIAELHSRNKLDINPSLYQLWGDSLIRAVAASDPKFNDFIESAWRKMIEIGVRYLSDRYERVDAPTTEAASPKEKGPAA
jgi:hemoglobin-like flavoprotein